MKNEAIRAYDKTLHKKLKRAIHTYWDVFNEEPQAIRWYEGDIVFISKEGYLLKFYSGSFSVYGKHVISDHWSWSGSIDTISRLGDFIINGWYNYDRSILEYKVMPYPDTFYFGSDWPYDKEKV